MIPKRSPRILTATWLALTLIGALFVSPTLAKPPAFDGDAPASPETVSPSVEGDLHYVRFDVTFTNASNSNMPQVTMTAATPSGSDLVAVVAGPLVDGVMQGSCTETEGDLSCTIGTVNAGSNVTLSVVYQVPMATNISSMSVEFLFKSTGDPTSDPRRSHGDDFKITGTVQIMSGDFAGSYLWDGTNLQVETDQMLSKRGNPQSTQVTGPESGIPVTASEMAANAFDCPEDVPGECFGQWSVINVNNGFIYEENGFIVVIGYDQVPGNADDVDFVHLVGGGRPPTYITEECGSEITTNCIVSIENIQGDLYYTLILDNNGPIRGI